MDGAAGPAAAFRRQGRDGAAGVFAHSIVEGWKFSWHNQTVRAGILTTTIVCTLMFPFTTLLPVFARDLLSVGAEGQGLLLAAMGFGALMSATTIALAGHRLTRGRVMIDSSIVYRLDARGVRRLAVVLVVDRRDGGGGAVPRSRQRTGAYRRAIALAAGISGPYHGSVQHEPDALHRGQHVDRPAALAFGSRGAVAVMGIAGALGIVMLVWLMPRARHIK